MLGTTASLPFQSHGQDGFIWLLIPLETGRDIIASTTKPSSTFREWYSVSETVVGLVGLRRSPIPSRIAVLPTSPPPRMILKPLLAGYHGKSALMPRNLSIVR